jgi:hypothetical protein
MTKSITITYKEADEGLLMAFFKRLKIAINTEKKTDDDHEIEVVRKRLHDKYVVTGQWAKMNDEEREDAAHAETLIYSKEQGEEYLTQAESDAFLKEMETELSFAS